ncbi:MAG: helix-turn-helix transcriptional regulator [Lachnospiraceae bacterium]|nr:helix-turn-helix transcriptional regulator [Lachnospiraceae bacterium]
MDYGKLTLNIEKILAEKKISKNQMCKDLDIPRTNFKRYCRNECQRIDMGLICKLLYYLQVDISDLISYESSTDA